MRYLYTAILYLFFLSSMYGQVVTRSIKNKKVETRLSNLNNSSHFRITQKVDIKSLLVEDKQEKNHGLPFRFGKACLVNLGLNNGKWTATPEGRVWQLEISSPMAYSINLQFDDFYLSEGADLVIYNADKTMQIGPITAKENNPSRLFATDLVKGNSIILELFEPKNSTGKSQLHISNVVHGYKDMFENAGGFGQSSSCNIDVACSQGQSWQTEANGVAMVLLDKNTRLCSGALLNNACQNLRAYFLTAFHCLDSGSSNDWAFRFQYRSILCGGGDDFVYTTYNGSTLRASWVHTDFALLELNQRPNATTGIRYLGWSRIATAPASSAILHHPAGDVMKIAIDNQAATLNPVINWSNGAISQPNTHWTTNYDAGTTEGGSSGGPLFDQNHRIAGQLHGGSVGCPPNATRFYGRFDLSWTGGGTPSTRLSDWLSDDPAITTTNTIQIPSISNSGADAICTGNSRTFTLQNPPAGIVTWNTTSNLTPSSGTGTIATVSGTSTIGPGPGSITFTVAPNITCSTPMQLTYNVTVGSYIEGTYTNNYQNVTLSSSNSLRAGYTTVTLNTSVSGLTFNWALAAGNATSWRTYGSGKYLDLQLGYGQTATFQITSNCSTSSSSSKFVTFYLQNYFGFSIAPNPATTEVVVTANEIDNTFGQNESASNLTAKDFLSYEVGLYDRFGSLVKSTKNKSNERITKLNVQGLLPGQYILRINDGKNSYGYQFIINK
ncbi:MAG: trypsin-like peptidase domain-containing protein [Bacteroidota bacterium]